MLKAALPYGAISLLALVSMFGTGHAQTKLTTYPGTYDASQAGSALPSSAMSGPMTFDDEFKTLSVCADGVAGCNWYAPIVPKLGTGTLAQPTNRAAISLATDALTLQTIDPSSSGVGGTDTYMRSQDTHGHGHTITNGYIEAAISLPAAHGSHACFWIDNLQAAQGHGEVDFPETYGAGDHVFTSAVHYWPTSASRFAYEVSARNYWSPGTPAQEYGTWHRYGILLTASSICTYMDRKEVGCTPRLPEMSNPWAMELSVTTDPNRKDGYQPAMMRVAYVRAWGK